MQIAIFDYGETQLIFEVRGLKSQPYMGQGVGNILHFEGGTVVHDAGSEGVGLAPFHDADASIPDDVKAKLDEIQQGLADGSITTNVMLAWRRARPISRPTRP